jgi:hypothetical protein
MKSLMSEVLAIVLLLTSCVTAQQRRQGDIGPHTFPSAFPETTPSADRAPDNPTGRNASRFAQPSPAATPVPPATNKNTFGL